MKKARSSINYPSKLVVDHIVNEITGKSEPVEISTGPYRKNVCGTTQREVNTYLAHLVERYKIEKYQILLEKEKKLKREIGESHITGTLPEEIQKYEVHNNN